MPKKRSLARTNPIIAIYTTEGAKLVFDWVRRIGDGLIDDAAGAKSRLWTTGGDCCATPIPPALSAADEACREMKSRSAFDP